MHAITAGGLSNGAADPSRILRIAGLLQLHNTFEDLIRNTSQQRWWLLTRHADDSA